MPRSKTDPYKRKCAQALNHLNNAIVDLNDVYIAFGESIERMEQANIDNETNINVEAIENYKAYQETLKQSMMYLAIPREQILQFVSQAWGLDEESIKVYLG